ncbi:MAG: hypothetical protein ACR2O3_13415 [Rhizobiaceae bacterium]
MGFFGHSRNKAETTEEIHETAQQPADISDAESILLPFEMQAKEKQQHLEALKSRANKLSAAFDQVMMLVAESENTAADLASFVESTKLDVENEKRLRVDNSKLSGENTELELEIKQLSGRLEMSDAEASALKLRNEEYRLALDEARLAVTKNREQVQALSTELEKKNNELLAVNALNNELNENNEDLIAKSRLLEEQYSDLSGEMDLLTKRDSELKQSLNEYAALLEEESRNSTAIAGELEATKRKLSALNWKLVELESEHSAATQELEYLKNGREEDQRKFDNRIFGMRSEVNSLTSERKVSQHTIKNLMNENSVVKKTNKVLESEAQRLKVQILSLQKSQERDRKQIAEANEKLSDLNLRHESAVTELTHEQHQRELLQQSFDRVSDENNRLKEYRDRYEAMVVQVTDQKTLVAEYQQLLENGRKMRSSTQEPLEESISNEDDSTEDETTSSKLLQ